MATGRRRGRIVPGDSPNCGDQQYNPCQVTLCWSGTPVPKPLDPLLNEATKQKDERLGSPASTQDLLMTDPIERLDRMLG